MSTPEHPLLPERTFDAFRSYQQTQALKGAIELNLFTAIDEGHDTVRSLASHCRASQRGIRILCDYLVIIGFLTKEEARYALTRESAAFLSRRSPHYLGMASRFLTSSKLMSFFSDVAEAVRKGGTVGSGKGMVIEENPLWVDFARGMSPLMVPAAEFIAQLVGASSGSSWKILDLAAGHGMFGTTIASQNPNATVVALDWSSVLSVAQENSHRAGVADRYRLLPGNAFETDFGEGYDLILITNFFHHFDEDTCVLLMGKVHKALGEKGRAVTLEYVPNEDRISPPIPAAFSLTMLVSTPSGDAYTFKQYEEMFRRAGFAQTELHPIPQGPQQVLISYK